MLKKKRNRSIFITALLIVISLIVLLISFILTNRLQNKLAIGHLKMIVERTELENASFNNELNLNLKFISGLVNNGVFSVEDKKQWSSAMESVLKSNDNISAVSVVNSDGGEFFCSLHDSVFGYYFFRDAKSLETTLFYKKITDDKISSFDTTIITRAINLENYTKHILVEPDTIIWYNIQEIPGLNPNLGLAASIKSIEKDSANEYIITIYVSLSKINKSLHKIAENVNSEYFLFTEDHKILNVENDHVDISKSNIIDYLVDLDSVKSPLYKEVIINWEKYEKTDSIQFQLFKYKNDNYWSAVRPTKRTIGLWIALIVPENDFLTILKERMGLLFFIPLFILLISLIVLVLIIRKNFFRPPVEFSISSKDILKLIEKGEDEHIEFKSTVRTNLFTNKPGKEIELAWLKSVVGFCNSMGGTILIGVSDNGEILGLEPDNFANDDKCLLHVQNLIRDHIGMEFTKYINYRLISQGEKKILVVNCMMAPEPLFLLSNNKEQFYVRSGPASIELPMSKALKYIKDRKKD